MDSSHAADLTLMRGRDHFATKRTAIEPMDGGKSGSIASAGEIRDDEIDTSLVSSDTDMNFGCI